MNSLLELVKSRVRRAVAKAFGVPVESIDPAVTSATDPRFGHYQCNAAMGLARQLKQKPGTSRAESSSISKRAAFACLPKSRVRDSST